MAFTSAKEFPLLSPRREAIADQASAQRRPQLSPHVVVPDLGELIGHLRTLVGLGRVATRDPDRQRELTIGQLEGLLEIREYADALEPVTIRELASPLTRRPAIYPGPGELIEEVVMRVFDQQPWARLTSGFFCRHMGLPRWTAQKVLVDLTERGLLVRSGKTSSTCYQLAVDSAGRRRRTRGR